MSKIGNAPRDFIPVNIAVMTVSDSRTLEDDKSGQILVDRLTASGHILADRAIVTDDVEHIVDKLNGWIADAAINVVISTGGTGVTGRDVTPEAFESIYDKSIPGFGEMFRLLSYEIIGVSTIQSRATAGVTNGTYLFAVPGSPGACKDAWDGILESQLDYRHKPCNFVELMDRLLEGQPGRS